jgi:hypothetical protein
MSRARTLDGLLVLVGRQGALIDVTPARSPSSSSGARRSLLNAYRGWRCVSL